MKLEMFATNDVLNREILRLILNDQRPPGDRLFMMAAEIEVFLLFELIEFATTCASGYVYWTDLLGVCSHT